MSTFAPIRQRTVRWRPSRGEGLEHLTITPGVDGFVALGVVIGSRGGIPYGARYRIISDANWLVRELMIDTCAGQVLHLLSDGAGRWTGPSGEALPEFDGCLDADLAGSPFTNTFPIRRGEWQAGEVREFRMVYIPFSSFEPEVDGQRYTCIEPGRLFLYEAIDRSFQAHLTVDEDGLVVDYPTLFTRSQDLS